MVISSGQERSPRGRAKRVYVEVVVTKTNRRQLVKVRCLNHATKGSGRTETHIIHQDENHVGSTLLRFNFRRPRRFGLGWITTDHALELGVGSRQHLRGSRRAFRLRATYGEERPSRHSDR